MPSSVPAPPTRERGTLAHAPFRRLLTALLLTRAGNLMQMVASGWLVFQLTGDPMAVGLLGFLTLGPSLLGSPWGGRLADRHCPRRLATALSFLSAVGPLGLGALVVTDALTLPALYVLTVVSALPYAVNLPVRSIVVPFAVPMGLRERALVNVSAANNIADLVGAVTGGLVVQAIGPGLPYLFNASAHVLTAVILIASPVLQASCDKAREVPTGGTLDALRTAAAIPAIRLSLVGIAAFFALVAPVESQLPTLAGDHSDGAMALGFLFAAIGVGAMIGNPVTRWVTGSTARNTRALVSGLAISATSVALLGWSGTLASDVTLLMLFGFGWEWVAVAGANTLQLHVPPDIAGRMVGVYYLLSMGLTAVGALILGWLFAVLEVDPSLRLIGAAALAAAVVLTLQRGRITRQSPASPRSTP